MLRLVTALGAADLDDHVLAVVRVLRDEQLLEARLELLAPGSFSSISGRRYSFISGSVSPRGHLARLGELGVDRGVLAVDLDDRRELGDPAAGLDRGLLVTGREQVGLLRLQLLELARELRQSIEHAPASAAGQDRSRTFELPSTLSGSVAESTASRVEPLPSRRAVAAPSRCVSR